MFEWLLYIWIRLWLLTGFIPTCSVLHLSRSISPLISYHPSRAKCKRMAWVISRRDFNHSGHAEEIHTDSKKGKKPRGFGFWRKATQTKATNTWKRALTHYSLTHYSLPSTIQWAYWAPLMHSFHMWKSPTRVSEMIPTAYCASSWYLCLWWGLTDAGLDVLW